MASAGADASALKPTALPKEAALLIDDMIRSGKYKVLLDAIKGFRNGFVYGVRIRAPHALVLNVVWSHAPWRVKARRIYAATRKHSISLGLAGLTVSLVRSILRKLQGEPHMWHSALAGFIVGSVFWGEQSPVTVQMSMYILSRILSAMLFILAGKYGWKIPPNAFRFYSGVLWMIVMPLFLYHGEAVQPSMRTAMQYIYQDNEKYSSWYDLLWVNRDTSSPSSPSF
ncbi:peroxisomal membrane protein 4 [Trypanosoma conorhini]|uniref:Peroxisomal membrane protein 4 n=1 Tax=Trypanosoma conorhini TaxID=83891 RepID=A0A422QB33_9TRYP|nr:peroxisomal membrane protein 4 [Trypanosoma conorhini]RNF27168.1 peroxisomal membrane protein 4 [Trypanosoma conorhini]